MNAGVGSFIHKHSTKGITQCFNEECRQLYVNGVFFLDSLNRRSIARRFCGPKVEWRTSDTYQVKL